MKFIYLALLTTLLTACAVSNEIYTADGKRGHSIDCSGEFLTWGSCYEEAGKICGEKGYEILQKDSDQSSSVSGGQYSVYGSTTTSRSIIIRCKE